MKKTDFGAIAFLALFVLLILFFPLDYGICISTSAVGARLFWGGFADGFTHFQHVTAAHPYWMGFFKFLLLATFGEMLKARLKSGSWKISDPIARAVVWGLFGMLITFAFKLFNGGIAVMVSRGAWPEVGTPGEWSRKLWLAFSGSLWMNLIFAYPFMLTHEWCNQVIAARKLIHGPAFLEKIDKQAWGSFIPLTNLFFWIPAHTAAFLLPETLQVLAGAALSVALGFILTLHGVHRQKG